MSEEVEQKLLRQIEQLQREMRELKGVDENQIPTYAFSKVTHTILKKLVDIKQCIDDTIFDKWFNNGETIDKETTNLFTRLIEDNYRLIRDYSEEDLKIKFLAPILNEIQFKSYKNEFREFYEQPMRYETEDFILNGTTDFVIAKGLFDCEKPYFFIQEFKKGQTEGYPESQLLSELISAVEINNWDTIKGAYIVGAIWHFVILKRLKKHKYNYFVSQNFDSTKIDDLENIYKNLLFVKNEIVEKIEKENS
ncbi:MAG: hypothetical protein U9R39_06535 [Campylobacterota bacterium]|nr:hypothetical protein [Campylobacterota bacterium]